MARPRRGQSPYIVIKLNRQRCGARIEELVRRTRRSPANIVELLIDYALVDRRALDPAAIEDRGDAPDSAQNCPRP